MPHARIVSNHRLRTFVLIAAALVLPSMACGEDIDLYKGVSGGGNPNLIMLLDNSAAWDSNSATSDPYFGCSASVVSSNNSGKAVGFEQCALYTAVTAIGTSPSLANQINLGLMLFDQNSNGGKFNYPAMPPPSALPPMNTTGVANLQNAIKALDRQSSKTNNAATAGIMQEAWAYYSGHTGISNTNYNSAHAITNVCQKNFVVYIANASNTGKPQDTGTIATAAGLTANGATATAAQQVTIPIANTGPSYVNNWGDEWARYMNQTDVTGNNQNIITYTIAVVSPGNQYNQNYVNFLQSMASNGGGKAFVVTLGDTSALVAAITAIFNEVQATNSVFASVSLPVSVNAQGTSLNQVYVGMFRPDAGDAPRWAGNLKQYQLGFYTDQNGSQQVQMEDSLGNAAISSAGTGFITSNALSFWTADHLPATLLTTLGRTTQLRDGPFTILSDGTISTTAIVPSWPSLTTATATTPYGFWVNLPTTPVNLQGAGGTFDAPDGQIVDKGGVAEMIRADYLTDQTSRAIYTCPTGGCTINAALSTTKFDAATLGSSTAFGTSTTTATTNLINWVRGAENNDSSTTGAEKPLGPGYGAGTQPTPAITVRPSIHGDVLHSRPAVVNYGSPYGIVVFYGSNDGFFRAVNGNKDATAPGVIKITGTSRYVRPGGELWSFIAPDFFSKFQHLYNNTPSLTLGAATSLKDYFFDGTTTVYQDLSTTPSKTYIYVTARRGGRLIYAFDVSDPTVPKFLWSRTNGGDLSVLGQTWSQPKLALVNGQTNPVLIMGGGYDTNEDADPVVAADSMGNAIVMLDAFDGHTVWTACPSGCKTTVAAMTYAIPADITLFSLDGIHTDRLYAADLGGNIWRADIDNGTTTNLPASWKVTQLAKLSDHTDPTGASNRKFFYPPDVTPTGSFDAVVAASGDREHPLLANAASTVNNRFYMLKDPNTGKMSVPSNWNAITEANLTDETGLAAGTTTPYSSTSNTSGFFITFSSYSTSGDGFTHQGEKAVNAPLTVAGYTYFGTNTPIPANSNTCSANLGTARSYAINFLTGAGLNPNNPQGFVHFDGGGLPPSPVFGLVAVDPGNPNVYTPVLIGGGNQTGSAVGGNNTSSLGANKVTPPNTGKRKRTYWFTEGPK